MDADDEVVEVKKGRDAPAPRLRTLRVGLREWETLVETAPPLETRRMKREKAAKAAKAAQADMVDESSEDAVAQPPAKRARK